MTPVAVSFKSGIFSSAEVEDVTFALLPVAATAAFVLVDVSMGGKAWTVAFSRSSVAVSGS